MGEMTSYELMDIATQEALVDEYVAGDINYEDAYDLGFINEQGIENSEVQKAWERSDIRTYEEVCKELNATALLFDYKPQQKQEYTRVVRNKAPVIPVKSYAPTCSECNDVMIARFGKFGKFYFCDNGCPDQKTISDKNWQTIMT